MPDNASAECDAFWGKHAIVTGGTRGIGRAVTLALAGLGCTVYAIHVRNREAAKALSDEAANAGLNVRCVRTDLTDSAAVAAVLGAIRAETKKIDIVVLCAASGVHRNVIDLSPKHLSWTVNTNFLAAHLLLSAVIPIVSDGGRILAISSAGSQRVLQSYAAIGASKAALEALFRYYAVELAPRSITVNVVSPGLVVTDAIEVLPDGIRRVKTSLAATPTGRLTTPEEVAGLTVFLCSSASAQITGQIVVIDGGRSLVLE